MVVLPEPFGPIRPSTSFSLSSNDIALTATRPPKRLVTCCTSRAMRPASGIAALPAPTRKGAQVSHDGGEFRAGAREIFDQADHAAWNKIDDEQEANPEQQSRQAWIALIDQLP